ncbi:MAG: hypothetical protein AB1646_12550 [Thermodesulfobacteriota bacterium]
MSRHRKRVTANKLMNDPGRTTYDKSDRTDLPGVVSVEEER